MNSRKTQIGFTEPIPLEWLERTANLVLAGNDRATVRESLHHSLRDKITVGKDYPGSKRQKVINILLHTWFTTTPELKELQDEGLEILQALPRKNRIAVHWSMALAAYPFWGAVAAHTGRLLRLQGTAAAAHVQRRIKEDYGERETASRAAQRVLRSFVYWGVLSDADAKGVYHQGEQHAIKDPKLIAWMAEASLRAKTNGSAAPIKDLLNSPALFPFRLSHIPAEHMASLAPRLQVLRHGLDDDLILLPNQPKMISRR